MVFYDTVLVSDFVLWWLRRGRTCLSPSAGIGEAEDMTPILLVVVVFFGAIEVWSPFSTGRILEANRCQPNWRQGQGNDR